MSAGPFRDELAAAHAKIVELEETVRTLAAENERLKLPSTRRAPIRARE